MDLSDTDLRLIKNFIFGKLSPVEQQEFSARLSADAEFQTEVDFHQKLFATMHDREGERLKKMLAEVENGNFPTQPSRGGSWLIWLLILLAGSAAAWFVFFREKPQPQPEQIFAENFQPFENTEFVSTRTPETPVEEAWKAYDQRDFEQATVFFSKMPASEKSDASEFFKANALLVCGKTADAVPILELLEATQPPSKYTQPARWYLALAKIRLGEQAAARNLLEKIARQSSHFKSSEAADLLSKL